MFLQLIVIFQNFDTIISRSAPDIEKLMNGKKTDLIQQSINLDHWNPDIINL